jgi:hypothetical protein
MPEVLRDKDITVRFSSQIAKAQRLAEIQSVDTFLASIANMAQFKPEVLNYIDEAAYVKIASQSYNVPASLIRSQKKVDEIQKAQAEAGAKQEELANAQQESEVAKNVAQAGAQQ